MGAAKVLSGAALLTAATTVLSVAPSAAADYGEYAMNGTYSVVSNGEWAQMNDRYQDEPSVRSTWTVVHHVHLPPSPVRARSPAVWVGPRTSTPAAGTWYVKHYVPDWIPCPDGGTGPGLQVYKLLPRQRRWPVAEDFRTCRWAMTRRRARVEPAAGTARWYSSLPVKITKIALTAARLRRSTPAIAGGALLLSGLVRHQILPRLRQGNCPPPDSSPCTPCRRSRRIRRCAGCIGRRPLSAGDPDLAASNAARRTRASHRPPGGGGDVDRRGGLTAVAPPAAGPGGGPSGGIGWPFSELPSGGGGGGPPP